MALNNKSMLTLAEKLTAKTEDINHPDFKTAAERVALELKILGGQRVNNSLTEDEFKCMAFWHAGRHDSTDLDLNSPSSKGLEFARMLLPLFKEVEGPTSNVSRYT